MVTEERWTSYCCPVSIVDRTDAMDLSVNDLIMSHVVFQNNTRVMLGSPQQRFPAPVLWLSLQVS